MTVFAEPVAAASSALDRALDARDGPGPVAHFLTAVAPGEVSNAVHRCLMPGAGAGAAVCLRRAKLKPGRRITAEYGVVLPVGGLTRRIWVTWVGAGAAAPGPAADGEAEAFRRGVLAPFERSWTASHDGRMSVSVAPVDGAFPQLVRLHDRGHLLRLLRRSGAVAAGADVAPEGITVQTVRYRPGQRHVLRIAVGAREAVFAKVYRDDSGRRAVDASERLATALAAAGDGAVGDRPGAGAYVAADRVALWPELPGTSLAAVVARSAPAAGDAVRAVGSALRLVHDAGSPEGLPTGSDAVGQAAETLRTAQVLDALLPAVGSRLRLGLGRALELLDALPVEPPTMTHGDFKCDNLLVNGSRVHVLDFDRLGRGDPAADVGKFMADLRWWTDGDGPVAARLHQAFLDGYGTGDGTVDVARIARARVYDGLLQLRMVARRVPIQDTDWEPRVTRAVDIAAATLGQGS
jgi:aminoglycoside phosphotransferase (APT) family kinase protein